MFDVEKVRRLTNLLQRLPEEFSDVYVVPEVFTQEAAALFRRLKIPVRAAMDDTQAGKNFFGLPVVKMEEASANFNERTILIVLAKKSVPFIQTTFDLKVRGGQWTLPALVMAPDEVLSVYDRVTFLRVMQQYQEDGISHAAPLDLPDHFARGLTTFLEPPFQNFKYRLWESRVYYKPTYTFDDTAIVIQGPIAYENNYTAETMKLYRSIYPNAPIIISTWKNEATDDFRRACQENSVVLLENEMPADHGVGNMTLQLKSSLAGVKFIRENTAAKFVLKTRTDQRINRFEFLVYFKNLLETFPPKGDKLRKRIIFLGSYLSRAFPFHPHDFLAFGDVEDIFKLYDIPAVYDKVYYYQRHRRTIDRITPKINHMPCWFDYDTVTELSKKLGKFNKVLGRIRLAEIHLARTFYEKYFGDVDERKVYETGWKFFADYLLLIDFDDIQFDWPKYERSRYRSEYIYGIHNSFMRWLDMYRNFKIDWV